MAVTATPCPIGMLPMEEPDHSFTGVDDAARTRPGNSMPVCLPKPNALTHL